MRGAKRIKVGIHSRAAWQNDFGPVGHDGGRTRYSAIVDGGRLTETMCVNIW